VATMTPVTQRVVTATAEKLSAVAALAEGTVSAAEEEREQATMTAVEGSAVPAVEGQVLSTVVAALPGQETLKGGWPAQVAKVVHAGGTNQASAQAARSAGWLQPGNLSA